MTVMLDCSGMQPSESNRKIERLQMKRVNYILELIFKGTTCSFSPQDSLMHDIAIHIYLRRNLWSTYVIIREPRHLKAKCCIAFWEV